MHKRPLPLLLLLVALVSHFGCSDGPRGDSATTDSITKNASQLMLIATTGQVHDALVNLTEGVDVKLKRFCGPGVDPHSFQASTNDVRAMEQADAIFYNGFHLEAQLHELLTNRYEAKSWAMSEAFPEQYRLDWVEDGEIDPEAPYDPHIWNHLPAWKACVEGLAEQLAELDPANAEQYRSNGVKYIAQIEATHQWAKEQLGSLPQDRRFLVSGHDAFNYFAQVYDLRTVAVLGIGNDAEADIRKMREVAETICEHKIPVIFMESITNPKVTQALQEACQSRDWDVRIADEQLYSDDLGEMPPQDTFLGAFRSNVEIITKALSP